MGGGITMPLKPLCEVWWKERIKNFVAETQCLHFFTIFVHYIYWPIMSFWDNLLECYSWQGVALLALFVVLFVLQLYYYVVLYYRIYTYRLTRRSKICSDPAISVIVVVRGENEYFLTDELPALLHQQYSAYEIVVVYVGGDMDYYGELQRIKDECDYMRLTKMGGNERLYITTKQALNVGIKSAQYDALLFTAPGVVARSERWIEIMSAGFEYGSVVVGPALPQFEKRSLKNYLLLMAEVDQMRAALAGAVTGNFYFAPRTNFGFRRELYNGTKGFDYLCMDIGENDLYLHSITTPKNLSVVLSPYAVLHEARLGVWREWLEVMRFGRATRRHYPSGVMSFHRWEMWSRVLLFVVAIVMIAIMPLEVKLLAVALLLLRYAAVLLSTARVLRRLGQRGLMLKYWLYDIVGPAVELIIDSRSCKNKTAPWK